jgi:RNA polymerase sigma factor (sigma-70 family)
VPAAEAHDIEALYREHRAGLVRLVERQLRDRDEAEDVVQTAFLDAQRALERGTIPRNPPAWLAAIALNAARRVRRRHVSVEALEDYATQQASRLPEIKAALGGLPKHEQTAILYRDVLGLSYAEMAEQMETTVPAVTMLLHRARARLRGLLGIALVGGGVWRWLRGNEWEAAAANAAGVVVVAGGLAAAGLVTGGHAVRSTAPAAAVRTAAAAPQRHEAPVDLAKVRTNVRVVVSRAAQAPEARSSSAPAHAAQSSPAAAGSHRLPAQQPAVSEARPTTPILPRPRLPRLSAHPLPALVQTATRLTQHATVATPATAATAAAVTAATVTAATAAAVTAATAAVTPVTTQTVAPVTAQTVTTPVATVTVSLP